MRYDHYKHSWSTTLLYQILVPENAALGYLNDVYNRAVEIMFVTLKNLSNGRVYIDDSGSYGL